MCTLVNQKIVKEPFYLLRLLSPTEGKLWQNKPLLTTRDTYIMLLKIPIMLCSNSQCQAKWKHLVQNPWHIEEIVSKIIMNGAYTSLHHCTRHMWPWEKQVYCADNWFRVKANYDLWTTDSANLKSLERDMSQNVPGSPVL